MKIWIVCILAAVACVVLADVQESQEVGILDIEDSNFVDSSIEKFQKEAENEASELEAVLSLIDEYLEEEAKGKKCAVNCKCKGKCKCGKSKKCTKPGKRQVFLGD